MSRYGPQFGPDITFLGVPSCDLDDPASYVDAEVVIVGAPFDGGTSYRAGTRFGPQAIRMTDYLPHDGSRPSLALRTDGLLDLHVVDAGDVEMYSGDIESALPKLEAAVEKLTRAGVIPVVLGGDHSIALPELRALGKAHGPLAVLHFDSHTDTWDTYFAGQRHSAGTAFRRGVEEGWIDARASMQIGMRGSLFSDGDIQQSLDLGYEVVTTDQMLDGGLEALARRVLEKLRGRKVFLSFDLDVVDPAFAPGVQTPEAGGPSAREILRLLRSLRGLDLVGADVVEMNPSYDAGQISALLAATVAAEILALIAARRRDARSG